MKISEYKTLLVKHCGTKKKIKRVLKKTLGKIKFLENIYMSDGKYHFFSREFADSAAKERQELCQLSSACFSLLRDMS